REQQGPAERTVRGTEKCLRLYRLWFDSNAAWRARENHPEDARGGQRNLVPGRSKNSRHPFHGTTSNNLCPPRARLERHAHRHTFFGDGCVAKLGAFISLLPYRDRILGGDEQSQSDGGIEC